MKTTGEQTINEQPPSLLHNIGGPPRASILWRGYGRGPLGDETERIEVARTRGTWLHLCISIGQRDARYHRDWNSAEALLQLVEPGHALPEGPAGRRLAELIEAHTQALDWPRSLLTSGRAFGGIEKVTLDHAATAFVALAKSAGNLWLRDRPARLAPLQTPTLEESGATSTPGVRWDIRLWFPDGIPDSLLTQALKQLPRKAPRPNPIS